MLQGNLHFRADCISQGSVATRFVCDWILNDHLIANLPQSIDGKLLNIWLRQKLRDLVFYWATLWVTLLSRFCRNSRLFSLALCQMFLNVQRHGDSDSNLAEYFLFK